jgi:hypothetical protein
MPRHNPAGRLHHFLAKAKQAPADTPEAADIWAKVFGLAGSSLSETDARVATQLTLLRQQLAQVRLALTTKGVAKETWSAALDRASNAMNPRLLGSKWNSVTQHLTPDTLAVLALLAEMLPEDRIVLDDESSAQMELHLSDLLGQIETSKLPLDLQAFLIGQVNAALDALRDYPLRGPEVFSEASDRAAADWAVHQSLVRTFRDDPVVKDTFDIWPMFKEKAKNVLLLGQLAKLLFVDAPQVIDRIPISGGALPPAGVEAPAVQALPSSIQGVVEEQ